MGASVMICKVMSLSPDTVRFAQLKLVTRRKKGQEEEEEEVKKPF